MAEYTHLSKRHGSDHTDDGGAILGYRPTGLPNLTQEVESPRVGGPSYGLPELQYTPEVRVAHRPNKYPGPV